MFARIISEKIQRGEPFFLEVPSVLSENIGPGSMVLLCSGKKNASLCPGHVTAVTSESQTVHAGVELADLLHDGSPVLNKSLRMLAEWMADYYLTRHIDTINALLPAAVRTTVDDVVALKSFELNAPNPKIVNTALRRSIMTLLAREKKLTVSQLRRKLGKKHLYQTISELERGGYVTLSKKFSSKAPKQKTVYKLSSHPDEESLKALSGAPKQLEAVRKLAALGHEAEISELWGISRGVLQALVGKGLLEKLQRDVNSNFRTGFSEPAGPPKTPTASQLKIIEQLSAAVEKKDYRTFLLHGVTGSGKTLVYIEFLKAVVASGRTAIVLVPEISLTPQTAGRFREHFHDDITIMHSAMSDQEKYDAWHSLRSGRTRIALGARSTVFAPLDNLGAIIVDEEHDGAYKQDRNPRYHARDTAVMRALYSRAVCVLGSATPSFESYSNALNGKYTLLRLPERIDGAKMPQVRLISMKDSPKASPSISDLLFRQMEKRLEKKEQVILLQNRRGYSGSIFCLSCGHIPLCRFCNIPLVYHASRQQLRCHYCGHTAGYSAACEKCASPEIFYRGSGTERIEEELKTLFPGENILRMDVDTTARKGSHGKILSDFRDGKAGILLGTQMVAKGLDFPSVTMVGVLLADIGLNIPDFRASERIFSLLTQVAGRAGRSKKPGEVYLQVYNTESDVFPALLHGSYEEFFARETAVRESLHYPPSARLIKFECSCTDEPSAEAAAVTCREILERHLSTGKTSLLGPAPAGIPRLRGRYRYHLLLKLFEGKLSAVFIRQMSDDIMQRFRKQGVTISIDVDPQNLM
ncbi:MAG: primosomal protein N' [Chlorobiaceae bacterium]|nr:primosomal protein N' [Chlorobiaceae bacterium]